MNSNYTNDEQKIDSNKSKMANVLSSSSIADIKCTSDINVFIYIYEKYVVNVEVRIYLENAGGPGELSIK